MIITIASKLSSLKNHFYSNISKCKQNTKSRVTKMDNYDALCGMHDSLYFISVPVRPYNSNNSVFRDL